MVDWVEVLLSDGFVCSVACTFTELALFLFFIAPESNNRAIVFPSDPLSGIMITQLRLRRILHFHYTEVHREYTAVRTMRHATKSRLGLVD